MIEVATVVAAIEGLVGGYASGTVSLPDLSSELKVQIALLDGLLPPAMVDQVRAARNQIEMINASMLGAQRVLMTEQDRRTIEEGLDQLEQALSTLQ